ncbi:hypothetical protein PG985_003486 [Apiospora marii]|uniref:uncharacterized protein n=1 Tax=Apiospora marii TaxID=335849 RepID=UPI00312D9CB5
MREEHALLPAVGAAGGLSVEGHYRPQDLPKRPTKRQAQAAGIQERIAVVHLALAGPTDDHRRSYNGASYRQAAARAAISSSRPSRKRDDRKIPSSLLSPPPIGRIGWAPHGVRTNEEADQVLIFFFFVRPSVFFASVGDEVNESGKGPPRTAAEAGQ